MLTGTGIRIGTATAFDAGVTYPRGMASDGTTCYLFDNSRGLSLNLSTGAATLIGTVTNFDVSESGLRSATYHNSQIIFYGHTDRKIYAYNTSTGVATELSAALIWPTGITSTPDLWGLASLGGVVYGLDRTEDILVTVNITTGVLTRVGTATNYGLMGSPDIQSLTVYKGELIAASRGLQELVRINETTGVATGIVSGADLPDASPEALVEHDDQLLMAGSSIDALYRLYDVYWDEMIAAIAVDEGGNGSLDLSGVSQDAVSFEFAPSHTARSWLTISGTDLVITNAPDVTADTDFEGVVRAVRDSAYEDKTLTVRVGDAAPPPPVTPPTFTAPSTNYEVNERADDSIDSTGFFTGHTRLAFRSGYSAPSWLTISGLNVVITDAPDVLEDTEFTVPLTATNNDGSVNGSLMISVQQIDPAPVFGTPNRFDIDEGSSSVFDLSGDLQHTESLAYQSGYSAPSWLTISGLTLVITNAQQVSQDTDFDVLLAAESTKTAATADRTVTIRVREVAVPPPPPPPMLTTPGAPTSLSLSSTHNSITANWGAPSNTGGENPSRYDIRIDGGAWIDTGLDLTRTFDSLSPNTEYTIDVAAVNSEGRGTPASSTITTDPAPLVVTAPSAPTSLTFTATHNSITANWGAVSDNGNGTITHYDIRIDGGAWIDTGLDGTHTFDSLSPNTEYTIDVAAVNSAGRGTPARGNPQRTEMPPVIVPDAPTGLKVDLKPTSAVIRWAAVDGIDGYEVSYAEGASPGTTWIATGASGTRFFVKGLKRGTQYTFRVRGRNSAGSGAGSRPVTQNTPIASLHNALFFKQCINYFDNGERVSEHGNPSNIIREVADNDYQTFSNVTDYAIDMSRNNQPTRVDAVFIKSKGITRHSGTPTGGSGTGWTDVDLPATVKNWEGTEVSTTVAGFQHHLYLLDSHFTATSVRVQFEGTGVKVYEMMLLEFGISIDANGDFTEIATNFVDRTGVVHPDAGSGIAYTSPIGSERDKWEIDFTARILSNKTLLQTPEEFLYWRAENKNHVFCMEPSRFPWRIFPAVFLGKSVPVRYRTDDKTGGEILNFRVAEQ